MLQSIPLQPVVHSQLRVVSLQVPSAAHEMLEQSRSRVVNIHTSEYPHSLPFVKVICQK